MGEYNSVLDECPALSSVALCRWAGLSLGRNSSRKADWTWRNNVAWYLDGDCRIHPLV